MSHKFFKILILEISGRDMGLGGWLQQTGKLTALNSIMIEKISMPLVNWVYHFILSDHLKHAKMRLLDQTILLKQDGK